MHGRPPHRSGISPRHVTPVSRQPTANRKNETSSRPPRHPAERLERDGRAQITRRLAAAAPARCAVVQPVLDVVGIATHGARQVRGEIFGEASYGRTASDLM